MRLDELIEQLSALKQKHSGDLQVFLLHENSRVVETCVTEDKDLKRKIILMEVQNE